MAKSPEEVLAETHHVYDAEIIAQYMDSNGLRCRDLIDIRNAAQRVMESSWWKERYAARWPILVGGKAKPGEARATFDHDLSRHSIHFGKAMRNEWTLCHELAHVAEPPMLESDHDAAFRAAYVRIVRFVLGRTSAKLLVECLGDYGVWP